ncbi:MAG TPA: sulfotransferase domain-containing protein [Chthoniobacterales bacterium]
MLRPRWNLSSRARALSGADMFVISIPKSGRTWLRTFFCAYFCKLRGHEFTLQPERYGDPAIPRIVYSHDRFEHRTKGDRWDRLRGKYLVPRKELRRAPVVLLARDPRDTFVSLYLQVTRRDPGTREQFGSSSISELLRDARFGIGAIVATMNDWLDEFSGWRDFLLVRYESLRAAPGEQFRTLLARLDEVAPNLSILQEALEFSEFENMRQLEAAGAFDSKILQARDLSDPESFKVRRGKIGGYKDYLAAEDRQYAGGILSRLDTRFGYDGA